MFLVNLYRSSVLEVFFSKKYMFIFYVISSIAIYIWYASASIQFRNAYYNLGEFDTSILNFFATELLFFFPLLLAGAIMAQTVILRLRIRRWIKNSFSYTQFSTDLSPAEVGLIHDFELNINEVVATLLDLHFKKYIVISIDENGLNFQQRKLPKNLSKFETELINNLGKLNGTLRWDDRRFYDLVNQLQDELQDDLVDKKIAKEAIDTPNIYKQFIKTIFTIAGFVGILQIGFLIFDYDTVSSIVYPRFDVHISQLISLYVTYTIALVIPLLAFRIKLEDNIKSPSYKYWIAATGLRHFLKTVYIDRLKWANIEYMDSEELESVAPYYIAFQLEENLNSFTYKVLSKTN